MNRSSRGSVGGWMGVGKTSLILLAVAALLSLLVSCGDTVYEAKGGKAGADATTGTINIYVRDGAGQAAFTQRSDSVTVTLLNDPRNQGSPTSVLVNNGGVTFTGLTVGTYAVRVSKPGYATSFIGSLELANNPDDYTDKQDYYVPRTITGSITLYPLSAGLKGTLRYAKSARESGVAASAEVSLLLDAATGVEEREFKTTTDASGTFTFTGLPATSDTRYSLVALSKAYEDVYFEDGELGTTDKRALRPGVTTTLPTVDIYSSPVVALKVVKAPLAVDKDGDIVIEFTEDIDPTSTSIPNAITFDDDDGSVPVEYNASGKTLTVTPLRDWKGTVEVGFSTSFVSKTGKEIESDGFSVGVKGDVNDFTITNLESDGKIWLEDTTSAITVAFSKNINAAAYTGVAAVVNQSYHIEIKGREIVLTPASKTWRTSPALTLDFTEIVSVDGDAVTGLTNFNGVSVRSDKTPNFAIVRTAAWEGNVWVLGLADTTKALEFDLSGHIGTPAAGVFMRAYEITGTSWTTGKKSLEATFSGSKISVKPNPKWAKGTEVVIAFDNVVDTLGKALKGIDPDAGLSAPTSVTTAKIKVLTGAPFYVVTKVITFPAVIDSTPLDILFSAPIDPKFLSGKIGVYANVERPAGSGTFVRDSQLVAASLSSDARTLTLKPLSTQKWLSGLLSIYFDVSNQTGLRSVENVALSDPGPQVTTDWSASSLDISAAKVSDVWVDSLPQPKTLIASSNTTVRLKFNVARFGDKNEIIGGGTTPPDGWIGGSYIIQGVAAGVPVSYYEAYVGHGIIPSTLKRDTVTVTIPAGFDDVNGSVGGDEIRYSVTPKLGTSLGTRVESQNTAKGWVTLASTITSTGWGSYITRAQIDEDGEWTYAGTSTAGVLDATSYASPTSVRSQFVSALTKYEDWDDFTDEDNVDDPIAGILNRALLVLEFNEEIDVNALDVSLSWRSAESDLRLAAMTTQVVMGSDKKTVFILGVRAGSNSNKDDFESAIANGINKAPWGSSPGATAVAGQDIGLGRVSFEIENIVGKSNGAKFGVAYEDDRERLRIAETINIYLSDVRFSKTN